MLGEPDPVVLAPGQTEPTIEQVAKAYARRSAVIDGIDEGTRDIGVEERYIRPNAEYPDGSYLRKVDGVVEVATGFYALEFPDKPSPYWHGKAPFVMLDTSEWPWEHPPAGKHRAIEPSSVERITLAQRFGADMPSAKPVEWDEPLRPSPLMRRLGYTAHPDACTHYRKRLILGSTRWTCADCGVRL